MTRAQRDKGQTVRAAVAVQSGADRETDRAVLCFTLLLISLIAAFAGSLSFAVPHQALNGLTTVQP